MCKEGELLENLNSPLDCTAIRNQASLKSVEGSETNESSLKEFSPMAKSTRAPSACREDRRFYVYALLDPTKAGQFSYSTSCFMNEPFYIGKGCGNRAYAHYCDARKPSGARRFVLNKVRKLVSLGFRPVVSILVSGLTDEESKRLEISLIREIGRRDLGLGPLTNQTFGGDGAYGTCHTEESKRAQSERRSRLNAGNSYGKANAGKKRSVAIRQLLSSYSWMGGYGNKGKAKSESHRAAIAKATRGVQKTLQLKTCALCGAVVTLLHAKVMAHFRLHGIDSYSKAKSTLFSGNDIVRTCVKA